MGQSQPAATDERLLVNDILAHHGVKGMHWGTRKAQMDTAVRIGGNARTALASRKTSETKKAFGTKVNEAGGLHKISDKDLQTILKRLEMEQKYSKIQNEDAARRAEGLKAAGRVLGEIGKIVLPIALGIAANKVANSHSRAPYRTQAYTPGHKVINVASKALGS